jgi:hypothetical protein
LKKPVREKVDAKDLTKFEIVPEMITSGEDTRTTVMIRNIPKAFPRDSYVQLLNQTGLGDRYSFFYMPFDKRRNVHCGFAFLNFTAPEDVLKLHLSMATPMWHAVSGGQNTTPLAMSYARLQGQEQLMKHFSLSAVMYDLDARKRPFFNNGKDAAVGEKFESQVGSPCCGDNDAEIGTNVENRSTGLSSNRSWKTGSAAWRASQKSHVSVPEALALQPQYIPLPMLTVEPTSPLKDSGLVNLLADEGDVGGASVDWRADAATLRNVSTLS